jgi:hypothetical protein
MIAKYSENNIIFIKAQREIVNSALARLDGNPPETFSDPLLSGGSVQVCFKKCRYFSGLELCQLIFTFQRMEQTLASIFSCYSL